MKRLILIVASFLFALCICEVAARIFYHIPNSINVPQAVYDARGAIPVPYQHGTINLPESVFTYSNNSMGMRGPTEYGPKTKPRVLLLGDSITYGLGVNDDQTFAYLLQKQNPEYEFINGGNPNTGTDYALKFYQLRGRSLQPDVVVLSFVENDFKDNQRHWYFDDDVKPLPLPYQVTEPTGSRHPYRAWLIDHSRIAFLLKAVVNNYFYDKGLQPELTSRYLKALRDEVTADHGKLLVFYCPAQNHLKGSAEEDAARQIAVSLGVPFVAYRNFMTQADYLKEGHWNTHGHQIAAKVIASSLQK